MRSELRLDYDNNLNVMQIAKKSFVYLECRLETLNAITLVLKTAHVRDLEKQHSVAISPPTLSQKHKSQKFRRNFLQICRAVNQWWPMVSFVLL